MGDALDRPQGSQVIERCAKCWFGEGKHPAKATTGGSAIGVTIVEEVKVCDLCYQEMKRPDRYWSWPTPPPGGTDG